ncbi:MULTISPECIES: gamma carbonic anhydrase family protein [Prauserella salsuginis group]|uniref:Carbonic anhydrase/acetyltransferase-like protein (Isoleucine patch superfamily) n=2 Tax=Prauserella salsuginis group TaxID=2893672 RepID=A0A839XKM3_9PSEU|nr:MULTISPECIES: gamma carbonic anhydrase family protein [Prauserella salsuginis group]MBB3663301.1 carbonic anhydrase/acetyltransferase-like protein (isoleucine patch superfamily) [Prauserella sediminis]MCR3720871.1 Carbonic anhydrase or acetyltransferase, isoleucine patch superfamily [Prauserella flava]MCR3735048.1 Carbonic anhydrase or acetyltransferase, isoleucine patch superfamily [Prauserella salsuginis]
MPMFAFEGKRPSVHPEAWIAPTATLVGDVVVEKGASVWYGVVVRADFGRIVIREGANVQDNSVLHVGDGVCEVGANATVGHSCIVHDCTVGEQALIGNGATVLDLSTVGARTLVAAGSTVTPGTEVPSEVIAMGSPAKKFVPLTDSARGWIDHNAAIYRELARRHAEGVEEIAEPDRPE